MDSEELNIAVANEAFAENKVYMLEKQLKQANEHLNESNKIIRQQQLLDEENLMLKERIKRLEESENRMLNWLTEDCPEAVKKQLSNAWMKSKEAKP